MRLQKNESVTVLLPGEGRLNYLSAAYRARSPPVMSAKQTILNRELFIEALRHLGAEDWT